MPNDTAVAVVEKFKVRIQIDGQKDFVEEAESIWDAARIYDDIKRQAEVLYDSTARGGTIRNSAGKQVGRISQNGRVWKPGPWKSEAEPIQEAVDSLKVAAALKMGVAQ